ncbi:MAG: ATP-binding protein [Sedimentisphaerales bacterium]
MWSLKSRLMYGMISGITVLLIGFDLIVYHTISHAMFKQFDSSLESAANMMSASVEQDNDKLSFELDVEMMPEFTGGKRPAYYELWKGDGTVIRKSPSLGGGDLIRFASADISHTFKSFVMKNGRPVRAVAVNFLPKIENDSNTAYSSQSFVLIVARDTGKLLSQLWFLKYLLSSVSAGLLVLAYVVAQVVVKQGLSPLSAVAVQIDNIREDNLKSRIAGENLPDEILPIQRQLNSLLERLEISFERERAFNTNVAHELRTPLAGIRSIIDVTLTRSRDAAEYRSALSETLEIVNNMQTMVAKLLELARIENGRMIAGMEQIKLAELVDECWRPFSDKAAAAKIVFDNLIDKNFVSKSDKAALSIIFSNLLNNAAEYTNRSGRIRATSREIDTGIEIIFENTGNQLTEQQAETVFDCFWRGDLSRSGTGVHFGLGLALVKQLVELLGGKIRAEASNDLFSIYIRLPFV